jgi:hypothetical protein
MGLSPGIISSFISRETKLAASTEKDNSRENNTKVTIYTFFMLFSPA